MSPHQRSKHFHVYRDLSQEEGMVQRSPINKQTFIVTYEQSRARLPVSPVCTRRLNLLRSLFSQSGD